MAIDQIILPHLWRRYLSVLRALLCVVAAVSALVQPQSAKGAAILLGVIAAISATGAAFPRLYWRKHATPAAVIADALVFAICVAAVPGSYWLAVVAALYAFISIASQYDWWAAAAFTAVAAAWAAYLGRPDLTRLLPTVILLGALGATLSAHRARLLSRIANVSQNKVHFRGESQLAREIERERIAADFHDGPLQSFIAFQMRLDIVRKMFERNTAAGFEELRDLRELCESQVGELRRFVQSMRPAEAGGIGLTTAMRGIVSSFQKDSRITATLHANFGSAHDDVEARTDLLQIVREALNNVQKHSGASRVAITVSRSNGSIELQIEDDGVGLPFAGSFSLDELDLLRRGPNSIKRRVRSLNGDMLAVSHPGHGTSLKIRVPVDA